MKGTKIILFCYLLLYFNPLLAQFNTIKLNGTEHYISGINLPWNHYGWDFGEHDWWGTGYDLSWFEEAFFDLSTHGVNSVRVWVHCDGRANPNFDRAGYVIGLDDGMLEQLDDFVSLANDYNLMIIITLWSHDMFEDNRSIAGPYAGMHADLITDSEKTESYINHALIPMVQKLNAHCNLLAWEIMNEPEWAMKINWGGGTKQTVEIEEMQRFMGRCIQAIRNHSDQNITIGAATSFGNNNGQPSNYWHERDFQRLGFDQEQVYLDFYSIHFYNWMGTAYSPFLNDASKWQLSRPILVAEASNNIETSPHGMLPLEQLEACYENNYAGILFWSYNAEDEYSEWEDCRIAMDDFEEAHSELIRYSVEDCDSIFLEKPLLVYNMFPNPTKGYVNLAIYQPETDIEYDLNLFLIDASGRMLQSHDIIDRSTELDISNLPAGFYFLQIKVMDHRGTTIQTINQKLIKI